ncbi:hypothetical protein PV08_09223 [Exophiala spinifera]|uniref:Protection of telomeres protein 1 n=1 Tax=Exophiala spinifera TaxID=91928 RepID=A0A0D2AZT7_9EURO|nr:uncharacterized protein PV08_09223 [Exophiala spinifera]KIW11950.1 hypothetical protein PV08_09223 [Exophiala spinifera]
MEVEPVPIPPHFISLTEALNKLGTDQTYNVVGVCIDFFAPTQTRTGDYMLTFTLHDPWWTDRNGMKFRFFNKTLAKLPKIQHQGDVVILRNIKTIKTGGAGLGVSNASSIWLVLPFGQVRDIVTPEDVKTKAHWSTSGTGIPFPQNTAPNVAEIKYARYIAASEDPLSWGNLPTTTGTPIQTNVEHDGGQISNIPGKFRLIKDVFPHKFADILGEVRKFHFNENYEETHLQVTDYTTHKALYNRQYRTETAGLDGDEYGYIKDSSEKQWPGPWGQMTMDIILWAPHSGVARREIKPGSLVFLRNVHIKMDKNQSKLEGVCHTEQHNSERVNITVVQPTKEDHQMKALISRKHQYAQQAKAEGKPFYWSPLEIAKKRKAEEVNEPEGAQKNKKTKNRNRKKNKARTETSNDEALTLQTEKKSARALNTNVRCNAYEVPRKSVSDILDPDILLRKSLQGKPYRLPFQNCKYKLHVRVVDFYPDDIADFAVPRNPDYDLLSDDEDEEDFSSMDLTQLSGDRLAWEWRFVLLVEDARQPAGINGQPSRMEVLVAATDGDFLLNMTACNLRDKENTQQLATLKEKLFHLWGDLQERKEEDGTSIMSTLRPKAKPFECLIKEYGVPVRGVKNPVHDESDYDRMFRLFGTTI